MGVQCTKPVRPIVNHHSQKIISLQSELRNTQQMLQFTVRVEHLRLSNFNKKIHCVKFRLERDFCIVFPISEFAAQENLIKSTKEHSAEFSIPAQLIESREMEVLIQAKDGAQLQALKIKLHHLCTGPSHNDHLLKNLKSHLIFDFYIDQTITMQASCQSVSFQRPKQARKQELIIEHVQQEGQLSELSCKYTLSLILKNSDRKLISQHCDCSPSGNFQSAVVVGRLKPNQIMESTFLITIFPPKSNYAGLKDTLQGIFQILIPYSKFNEQRGFKTVNVDGISYDSRKLSLNHPLSQENKLIGHVRIQMMLLRSKQYAEQMECVVLSENGIVTVNTRRSNSNSGCTPSDVEKYINKLKKYRKYSLSQKIELKNILEKTIDSLQGKSNCSYQEELELTVMQTNLVRLLQEALLLLKEGEQVLNQCIFSVLDVIIHKEELSLRFLNAIESVQAKREVCMQYYVFICHLLTRIIQSTEKGISFQQLKCIQKCIAFAYFRFPWCQQAVISVLKRQSDPFMSQEKLAEIGASYGCKSPSKSFVFDWEIVYHVILNEGEFIKALNELQNMSKKQHEWSKLLFNRDYQDLFYGLYIELWNEADTLLHYKSSIKWQYFPHYGELLSIFLGEMNNSRIVDYSTQFQMCSAKLVANEKLLNTFMMLLFPKTCLYETYCVMKCLDLVRCYFEVIISRGQRLPSDFHFNYFYSGLKCIFESNHSYLLTKAMVILYKCFHIFPTHFVNFFSQFVSGSIFYQVFLHWSQGVRKIFHLLLRFKLMAPQLEKDKHLNLERKTLIYKYQTLIEELQQLRKHCEEKQVNNIREQYYQKMIRKLNQRRPKLPILTTLQSLHLSEDPVYSCQQFGQQLLRKSSLYVSAQTTYSPQRKWSFHDDNDLLQRIPSHQRRYIVLSLKQYEKSASEKNPDKQVEDAGKLYQQNEHQ